MSYNRKDYPQSMKNLRKVEREKAIDILNAILTDGYDEQTAIPIAISSAKKWYEDSTDYEKSKMKDKNLTKHKKHDKNLKLLKKDVVVNFDDDDKKWKVKTKGAKKAAGTFNTKKQAVQRAKEIASNKESDVEINKRN